MSRGKRWVWFGCALIFILPLLAGCGKNGSSEPTAVSDAQLPIVNITAPADQTVLPAGQAVQISVVASDAAAIARIELYVDNSLVESRVAPTGSTLTTMSEQFAWSASIVGSHALQARAYDSDGQMGASRIVAVQVQMPGAPTAGPALSPQPQPTSPAEATAVPSLTPVPVTAMPDVPMVVANLNANVRSGPGTAYPVIGGLAEGEGAMVTGRNQSSSWWQISYQGGVAWIANSVVTTNSLVSSAPVVSAPPPPATDTPVPPTPTPTPTGPTNTPVPTTGFRADQSSLTAGQCTTLRWDFDNIKAILISFGYGYDQEGQPGHGTREVCPSVTTEFVTSVKNQDDSWTDHKVTISVSGSGSGDPVIKKFAPTTYDVASGSPFSIFWEVDYAKGLWYIKGDGAEQAVGGYDSKIDETITEETTFKLKVEKNNGVFVYASFVVKLKE